MQKCLSQSNPFSLLHTLRSGLNGFFLSLQIRELWEDGFEEDSDLVMLLIGLEMAIKKL